MKQKYLTLLFLLTLIFVACTNRSEQSGKTTSISGEIVNPQSSMVIISENDHVIDTAYLDKDNYFYFQFPKSAKEGLYTLRHPYENYSETQMFYIKKEDSLQLRVNTSDFDNSIMYSGDAADENNFLMKIFLANRDNTKMLPKYYEVEPREFLKKIDSIRQNQLKEFAAIAKHHQFSKSYKNIIKKVIDYSNYDFKERYYFLVSKYNHTLKSKLSNDFLSYRDKVDFNDQQLQTYYIYQYFLEDYLKNRVFENCIAKGNDNCFDLNSLSSYKNRVMISDSLFKISSIRSRFFTHYAARYIVEANTVSQVDSMMEFLDGVKSFDTQKLEEIKGLGHVQKRQFVGNISHLNLINTKHEEVEISTILTKPTVMFYWSVYYEAHHKRLHQEMKNLERKYPEIKFIGINIDNRKSDHWSDSLTKFSYSSNNEFQLVCPPKQRRFYRNYLNKMVFVDKSGDIINGDLNINDRNIEGEILSLLNR